MSASANGWDTKVDGDGWSTSGCVPSNVLDGSFEDASHWPCNAEVSGFGICELALEFNEPQDIVQTSMILYKANECTRSLNVWIDGSIRTR